MKRIGIAFVVAALTAGVAAAPSLAQGGVTVESTDVENRFPQGARFSIDATAAEEPAEVRLLYAIAPDGTKASAVADCAGSTSLSCQHTVGDTLGTFVIPGTEITFAWEFTFADGASYTTDSQVYVYEDTRFDWETLSEGNVTVYYYGRAEGTAETVLSAALETLDRLGSILETEVTFPVKVFLYDNAQAMQPAILSPFNREGVVTLGEVYFSDTAMVSADVATADVTRHEIAHIVIREATKGPFDIPAWLNEGTAVWAQSEPLSGELDALEDAIKRDRVLSLKALASSSAGSGPDTVGLFYGQAYSLVKYLVDTYGEEKFGELFATFRDGSTLDNALQDVYGISAKGLEDDWRASVGLGPRAEPTAKPTAEATQRPTPSVLTDLGGETENDGFPVALLVALAGLAAALAVAVVASAIAIVRRRG